jgi:hypothetical protein
MLLNPTFNTVHGPGEQAPARNRARGYLGHKRPTWERADLAARDYVQGRPIEAPTLQQLAFAYRVSVASIQGRLNGNGHKKPKQPTLAGLVDAPTEQRVAAMRSVGIDKIIHWLCEAERVNVATK